MDANFAVCSQIINCKIHIQNVTGKTTWFLLIGVKMHVKQIAGYLKQMRAMIVTSLRLTMFFTPFYHQHPPLEGFPHENAFLMII